MTTAVWKRSPALLDPERSLLVVIDVQERLLPVIEGREQIVHNIRFLLDCAQLLSVRTVLTEQYPRGLGATVPELSGHAVISQRLEKTRFSAAEVLAEHGFLCTGTDTSQQQVVITGIESHVCVQQTAYDLLAHGCAVSVVADAVGSRQSRDYQVALQRMQQIGISLTTAEAAAFEWCETAGTDRFRTLSQLVRQRCRT